MLIEIEVNSPSNADLHWEPTAERVRGAFQPSRVKQESAGKLAMALPTGLPGQRIRLDTDARVGTILEPLATPAHAATRATVAKLVTGDESATEARLSFAPPERTYPGVHVPTWLSYMVKAVRSGVARIVKGELPADPPADAKPRVFSSLSRPPADAKPTSLADLLTALTKLTPAERKELAGILAAK